MNDRNHKPEFSLRLASKTRLTTLSYPHHALYFRYSKPNVLLLARFPRETASQQRHLNVLQDRPSQDESDSYPKQKTLDGAPKTRKTIVIQTITPLSHFILDLLLLSQDLSSLSRAMMIYCQIHPAVTGVIPPQRTILALLSPPIQTVIIKMIPPLSPPILTLFSIPQDCTHLYLSPLNHYSPNPADAGGI